MAIQHLILERRSVEKAGRRYEVRSPSVAAVVMALSAFEMEIQALRKTWSEIAAADLPPAQLRQVCLATFNDPGRLAEVLPHCSDAPHEAVAGDADLAAALLSAAVSLLDVPGLVRALTFSDPDAAISSDGEARAQAGAPGGPGAFEEMVDLVARRYGVTPLEVMHWPVMAALSCFEIAVASLAMHSGGSRHSGADEPTTPAEALAATLRRSAGKEPFGG